ncbi:putative membrane protein [Acaryochloris thomasi RCC1774]|uniref:Putative membrane protein n=1 Tax=Acaryochloris thomasi RCC1774 TaxID=1764569 RepID=A0A2W1JFN5_9CYAN|nr:DedA family protein [Acaryochloris thomasi]PZD72459.1 putative membrane protein [Acaryochloris thomasi RCC1774]
MVFDWLSIETVQGLAQQYGYVVVFLGILLESLGLPLPGESIVLVGGFLAGQGDLKFLWVVLSALAGAIVGGNCGYWIGVYGGWPLLLRVGKVFRVPTEKLEELQQRFSYNAGRAVFLGRFVALLRIFASPLAGIAKMPYGRFMIYNCAGAMLWATVMVSLAFFAGEIISLGQLVAIVSEFSLLILGGLIAWFVFPYLLRMTKRQRLKQAGESESS